MDRLLTIKNVYKRYENTEALTNVSLTIPEGSCYGLIGPNGAGKSTFMKIITAIIQADRGEILYNGKPLHQQMKQKMGYIPQEICLEQTVTALENLKFFGRLYGLTGKELKHRAEEILAYIGLTDKGSHQVTTFSGGMKRRLNIGCGLMNHPSFILMDEPTVGIDPQSRKYIFDMIEQLKENGCTIIYASHYIEEVEQLCDEIALIDQGQIIKSGSVNNLLTQQAQPAVYMQGMSELPPSIEKQGEVKKIDDGYLIYSEKPLVIMEKISQYYQAHAVHLDRLELLQPRLEDVFFSLTGNQLRD